MKKSEQSICPTCTSQIPADSPDGLCPKCLLEGTETSPADTIADRRSVEAPTIEEIAAIFPELEIIELLGVGGMGAVFKARQTRLDRLIALKVLASDLAKSPAFSERFNREAKVLALLSHRNIVSIFDFGARDGCPFLIMEFIDGVNLRQAMQAGRFSSTEALRIIPDICQALQFAHDEGVLHRDIKPENILIDTRGQVKIVDFGIAKLIGKQREDFTLTGEGSVLGSPHYMAPEQLNQPKEVDHRADIYSLGVVFYEMLTGELPMGRFAPPSKQSPVDSRIDDVVMRTLEQERQKRYQSAQELKKSVEALTSPGTSPAKEISPSSSAVKAASADSQQVVSGANLSAGLTTAGLVLLGFWGFEFIYIKWLDPNVNSFSMTFWGIAGLIFFLSALGFIFGAKGLRGIRNSGGQLRGLVRCIYASLAVPLLLLTLLIALASGMAMVGLLGPGFAWLVIATIITATFGTSIIVGSWRWARGTGWQSRASDELTTVSAVAAVVVLLPTLTLLIPWSMLTLSRAEMGHSSSGPGSSETSRAKEDTTEWRQGAPEVAFDVVVPPQQVATFRLVQHVAEEIVERTNLKGFIVASNDSSFDGTIQFGNLLHGTRSNGRPLWIIRVSGKKGGQGISSGDLKNDWNFVFPPFKDALVLAPNSKQLIHLAQPLEITENESESAPMLALELITQSRSIPGLTDHATETTVLGGGTTNWVQSLRHAPKS